MLVADELLEALRFVDTHLRTAKPTTVTVNLTAPWIIFTDGAYEPSQQEPGSIGGVLVDPSGRVVEFFGCSVNGDLMEEFLLESSHRHFVDTLLVHYIDNDAACSALVRADGATGLARALVNQYVDYEYKCKFFPWFARVPSHSNLSDEPSRLKFDAPWLKGARRVPLVLPAHLSDWGIERAC